MKVKTALAALVLTAAFSYSAHAGAMNNPGIEPPPPPPTSESTETTSTNSMEFATIDIFLTVVNVFIP